MLSALPKGVEHQRWTPHPELRPWLAHIWWVGWSLEQPHIVRTLPHPAVHWTFEEQAWIGGPRTAPFTRTLQGQGQVLGLKFRPAGFRDWLGASVHVLRDRRVVASEVLPGLAEPAWEAWRSAGTPRERSGALQDWLLDSRPERSPQTDQVQRWVAWMREDPGLVRVGQLSERAGVGVRGIQRRFKEWAGVSPKWVLRRLRMLSAVEAIKAGPVDLSTLALELGYADHAHFTRDFKTTLGAAPSSFGLSFAQGRAPGCPKPG